MNKPLEARLWNEYPRSPADLREAWNSRGLTDACRPYDMLKDFPPVAQASAELREKVARKFRDQIRED